jgi:hypothetical protein
MLCSSRRPQHDVMDAFHAEVHKFAGQKATPEVLQQLKAVTHRVLTDAVAQGKISVAPELSIESHHSGGFRFTFEPNGWARFWAEDQCP